MATLSCEQLSYEFSDCFSEYSDMYNQNKQMVSLPCGSTHDSSTKTVWIITSTDVLDTCKYLGILHSLSTELAFHRGKLLPHMSGLMFLDILRGIENLATV